MSNNNAKPEYRTNCDNMTTSELKAFAELMEDNYHAVISSTSWQITAPLRSVMNLYKHNPYINRIKRILSAPFKINNFKRALIYTKRGKILMLFRRIFETATQLLSPKKPAYLPTLEWIQENTQSALTFDKKIFETEIDIIIPVHNGYEYLHELFSSVKKTSVPFQLICVHDKSTDERVAPFLETLREKYDNITILNNEENLGFVKSVNKALKLAKNHVVLINTDVELPNEWLERLITPLYIYPTIASATPFTNSGTLCSFPIIGEDNDLLFGLPPSEIDAEFKKIKPAYYKLPTGIGFCMAMNIHAIEQIGVFDEAFGRGYGEENDWCRRAAKAGYKNVVVENLFVWHKHGGSFISDEKNALIKRNLELLGKKHPDYSNDIAYTYSQKPHNDIRFYLLLNLLSKTDNRIICYFDHKIGGGANAYTEKLIKTKGDQNIFFLIQYDLNLKSYIFNIRWKDNAISYEINEISDLENIFASHKIDEIIVSSLVSYPDVINALEQIILLKNASGTTLVNLMHDYFHICPVYFLLDYKNVFCGVSRYENCDICLKQNPNLSPELAINICAYTWRAKWKDFLLKCDSIIVFSNASKEIFTSVFGKLEHLKVIPHTVDYIKRIDKKEKPLNIGFLGAINKQKGLNIIEEMATILHNENHNIRLTLFGYTSGPIEGKNYKQTGLYNPEDLPDLTLEHDIDIFFITSIWPETFSYTTQEVIEMNMPIACFDIGAQAERVKKYDKGLIIPEMTAKCAIDTISNWYSGQQQTTNSEGMMS